MLIQVKHIHVLGNNHGGDGGGLESGSLGDQVQLFNDLLVGAGPADAVAGGHDFGEGAHVDDEALGIHALEGGLILALEAQLTIGVILNGGDAVLVDDLHEFLPPLQGPGAAAGVLEIGDDVDELHVLGGGQDLVQLLHDHAVLVGGDLHKLGLIGVEGVDGAQVGGAFHNNDVAGVDEQLCHIVQALLAAGGENDVVGGGVDGVLGFHAFHDLFPQGQVALGGAILQGGAALLIHNRVGSGLDVLHGEQLRRRQAAGKGDDLRPGGELQKLADVRDFHAVHSVSKIYHILPP